MSVPYSEGEEPLDRGSAVRQFNQENLISQDITAKRTDDGIDSYGGDVYKMA